jgi:hypothetical protein
MVQLLFRMIDMKPDFQTSTFDTSLLGHWLLQWSNLPDSAAIHHIWKENPRLLTFLWFSTLPLPFQVQVLVPSGTQPKYVAS